MENKYSTENYKKIKDKEREELKDALNQGIKGALNSERYKNFLNIMSRCHNYSYTNSLLISLQNENATLVRSFTDWRKDKVSINKNEKGIKIFCPVKQVFVEYQKDDKGRIALDENGEKIEKGKIERTTFKVGRVFDISQTNADRDKYELKKESNEKILNKDDIISTLEKVSGIKINLKNSLGRANGLFNPEEQKIEIRANMGDIKTISTCIHEVAHSLLHNKSNVPLDNFTWNDTLPTEAVRLDKIYTGTWNEKLEYSVWHKTNKNDFKMFIDKLDSEKVYELDFNNLELQEDEYITEFEFRFGTVKIDFKEIESPIVYVNVLDNLKNGFTFTNNTRVSGNYLEEKIEDKDEWTTIIYNREVKLNRELPKTGC